MGINRLNEQPLQVKGEIIEAGSFIMGDN